MFNWLADAIAAASRSEFFFPLMLAIGVVVFASWRSLALLKQKRLLEDTPTAVLRSAPQGYVELQGHAELIDGDPVRAPLSLRPCVWYRYEIEQKRTGLHGRRSGSEWRTIERDTSDNLFHLNDGTGRCVIDPEGATVTPTSSTRWFGRSHNPGRIPETKRWESRIGLDRIGCTYRYREDIIAPNSPLLALGWFTTHGGAGMHFDRSAEMSVLLRGWKSDQRTLLEKFDTNSDGQIDAQEWRAVRQTAAAAIDRQREHLRSAPPVDVLCASPNRDQPFLLSIHLEADLLRRIRWQLGTYLVLSIGGVLGILATIALRLAAD